MFFPGQTVGRLRDRNVEHHGKSVHTHVGNTVSNQNGECEGRENSPLDQKVFLLFIYTYSVYFTYSTVQFRKQETHLFMLRVLVGLIILYDHVHPNGAFVKTSNIDIKGCIRLLKDQQEEFQTENLLNALRFVKS